MNNLWPRESEVFLCLSNILKEMQAQRESCRQDVAQFSTNQAVYNHFMALKIAYEHCIHILGTGLKQLYPDVADVYAEENK